MLNFRFALNDDVELYFKWANDSLVRKNSINTKQINLEDHIDWFNRKVTSPNVFMYLFFNEDDEPVGQAIIERKDDWVSIGISLAKEHRGKKYSTEILTKSTDDFLSKFKKDTIVSIIKSANIASLKMTEKSGFNIIDSKKNEHNCLVLKGYQQDIENYIVKSKRLFNLT